MFTLRDMGYLVHPITSLTCFSIKVDSSEDPDEMAFPEAN